MTITQSPDQQRMLDQLPAEIIEQILGYLPSISAILNLSCTNRRLHQVIVEGDSRVFRAFVKVSFPSIQARPPWRQAAFALTSRSRAWDRRAFIARECAPPQSSAPRGPPVRTQWYGHVTRVDSYETGDREVVAIGAGGRLRLRTTGQNFVNWQTHHGAQDDIAANDILDVFLLRPHQIDENHAEFALIRRRNGEVARLTARWDQDEFSVVSEYAHTVTPVCMDVSLEKDALIATGTATSVQVFPVLSESASLSINAIYTLPQDSNPDRRKGCMKFLSNSRIILGYQYLRTKPISAIDVLDVTPSGISTSQLVNKHDNIVHGRPRSRESVTVIAKTDSSSNNLFLAGWGSGVVSLYDLRSGSKPVRDYSDNVDDDQIWSLLPIGHERFLAGSSNNACLKMFDMRMEGQVYAYPGKTRSNAPLNSAIVKNSKGGKLAHPQARSLWQRDINIFVAPLVPGSGHKRPWQPLPEQRSDNRRLQRYRGSIYSLSSPSPASPTVYAGIENHVIQLDFVNTDDIVRNRNNLADEILDERSVLNLSCYERPRPGYESTDTILLRKQADWQDRAVVSEDCEPGWDQRWRLRTPSRRGWDTPRSRDMHRSRRE